MSNEKELAEAIAELDNIPVVKRPSSELIMNDNKVPNYHTKEATGTDDKALFLREVNNNQMLSSTEIYNKLAWSMRKGTNIRDQAIKDDLVNEDIIETGRRGRTICTYSITEKGAKYISVKISKKLNKGGSTHEKYNFYAETHYKNKGYTTYREKDGIDLIAIAEDDSVAVEVELWNTPHVEKNIRKALDLLFPRVEIICRSSKLLKILKKNILSKFSEEESKRIYFRTLSQYLQ